MEKKLIYFIIGLCDLISCTEGDVDKDGCCHAYYTLVNKSDYDVRLKYYEWGAYTSIVKSLHDTVVRKDSSYTMEVVWEIMGQPFKRVDTLWVEYGDKLVFEDYSRPRHFKMIRFSDSFYYEFTEKSEYINRATYTITNADYEYSKQKLAEREAEKEENDNGNSRKDRR